MATPASRLAVGDTFAPFFSGLLKPGSVVSVSRNSDGLDMFVRVDDTDEPISHSKAYSHTARIWATPGVPGKGKRLKLDPAYSFVFEGVRGYTYGEKWRLRHISTENGAGAGSAGKVTIPVLTKRVEASARLAGANRRGQEIDPRVAESEWDRIFVVHGLRNYGAPVQRSMRDSFMTAFWRGAARGLANPAVRLGRGLDEIALAVDTVPRLTRERLLDDSGARVMELVIRRMSLSVDEAEQIAKEASRRDGGPASGKRVAEVFQELDRGVMDMNAAQRLERLANPAGKVEKNPKPAVTDRALRYRANANPPKGPKRCLFCGSTRNVEVGHLDGHEENNDRSNLAWNCRSCNTTLGHAFKKLGIGRRTRQYNPEGGAKSLGQWVQALQSLRGESGTMEPAAALEMIRATPADDRSAYSLQAWRTRRKRYGSTGRQNPEENLTTIRADYPGIDLDVYENADAVTLNLVRVPAAQRGKGIATAVMKRLMAYADSKSIPIVLTPSSDFGSSKSKLERWYKSLGFVPNAGRHKDFRFRETMIRLPRPGKRNPEGPAAELYERFHGKPSERIDVVEESVHYHENLAALGRLVELQIKTPTRIKATLAFAEEGPDVATLASSEDGRQLFIVGGNQELDLRAIEMDGSEWARDLMDVGELTEVTYHTQKGFHKFEPINYFHKLGEETGVKPRLLYDTRSKRLLIAGGQYEVKPEGIVN